MEREDYISKAKGKSKGILFDYDPGTQTLSLGVTDNGKFHNSYVQTHNEILSYGVPKPISTEDLSITEIIAKIVLKAREAYKSEILILCPRNVAHTNREEVNAIYNAVHAEEKGNSETKYQRLLNDIESVLKKLPPNFTTRDVMDKSSEPRKELGAQNATRFEIEAGICEGRIKKTKQGIYGTPSVYQKFDDGKKCKFWTKTGDGTVMCTCPKEKFTKVKKDKITLNSY